MRLYDLATIMRSKNAGPFVVTIDIFVRDAADLQRVMDAPDMCAETIAGLYDCDPQDVQIRPQRPACAVKVSFPRPSVSSGAPGDRDVYGCQQHFPLGDIEV